MDYRLTSAKGGPWYEFYRVVCDICGHKGGCMIHEDGNRVVCIRVASDIEYARNSAIPGWLHFLKGEPKKYNITFSKTKQNKKRSPDELDRVYRALLNELTLAPAHREHLKSESRKFTDEQIRVRGYKSFPQKPWQVVKRIKERIGEDDLVGIPGFFVREGKYGPYQTISGFDGILIPFRDNKNRIVGMQYRVDEVKNDVTIKKYHPDFTALVKQQPNIVQIIGEGGEILYEGKFPYKVWKKIKFHGKVLGEVRLDKGQRYFWLSSANKEGGTGAGDPTPIHISVPLNVLAQWAKGNAHRDQTVWLIEGALKADICADKVVDLYDPEELQDIGTTFIAIPGANSWRLALPYLREMGVQKVNIALDADATSNPHVKKHLFQLAKSLQKGGYAASLVLWNADDGKGLDDLYLNHRLPHIKPLF